MLTQEQIGIMRTTAEFALGEKENVVIPPNRYLQLLDMAEKLLNVRKFCNDNATTHCYTDEAQIGYDTAKALILQITED